MRERQLTEERPRATSTSVPSRELSIYRASISMRIPARDRGTHPCADDSKLAADDDLAALTGMPQRLIHVRPNTIPAVRQLQTSDDHGRRVSSGSLQGVGPSSFFPSNLGDAKNHRQTGRRVLLLDTLDARSFGSVNFSLVPAARGSSQLHAQSARPQREADRYSS